MKFLHFAVSARPIDVIEVTLSSQARVLLLDSSNFAAYRSGRRFRYLGGWAKVSPCRLSPSRSGQWHVVVDLAGHGGSVRARVAVRQASPSLHC